jgi:hypothetical protein
MEFIDKKRGQEWAHPILKSFLDRCKECTPYPADLFAAMKSDLDPDVSNNPQQEYTYRRILIGILDESHNDEELPHGVGHCCYCMRTINASDTHSTLEHVIPNMTSSESSYKSYYSVPSELEKDEHVMVYKEIFDNRHKRIAPPFPHNVAYENLVASCDGCLPKGSTNHVCCNNPRGDNYIPPFIFMQNVHQDFKYKSNSGNVIWKNNPDVDSKERMRIVNRVLNLNCSILKVIRMIWFFLSENGMDCKLSMDERRKVIDSLRPQCVFTDKEVLQNFLESDNYWNLLEEYRYFNDKNKFE